jgi:hypothetical protein
MVQRSGKEVQSIFGVASRRQVWLAYASESDGFMGIPVKREDRDVGGGIGPV